MASTPPDNTPVKTPEERLEDLKAKYESLTLSQIVWDPRKIPCFKESLLCGLGVAGVVAYFTAFRTRNLLKTANYAGIGYFVGSAVYWPWCRHDYDQKRKVLRQLIAFQEAQLQKQKQMEEQPKVPKTSNESCH